MTKRKLKITKLKGWAEIPLNSKDGKFTKRIGKCISCGEPLPPNAPQNRRLCEKCSR